VWRWVLAYRLGWFLYWVCIVLAGAWALAMLTLVSFAPDFWHILIYWLMVGIPALALYGLGRGLRYVLSGD
jgi:hypothetical protein